MKKRATPTERMVVRISREAGATVRPNVFLRDMNVDVSAADGRNVEVFAQDFPCFGGVRLAVDSTHNWSGQAAADWFVGHRNGRKVDRRSCPGALAALPSRGARTVHALPSVDHVGTQMETHACHLRQSSGRHDG